MSTTKDRATSEDRKFCLELYPDAENYDCETVLGNVESVAEYAYILHDKDTNDEGELKKPHYHVCIRYKNPRKISTVARAMGIPENYVQFCNNWKSSLKYLIHDTKDSRGKFQYSVSEIVTNNDLIAEDLGKDGEGQVMLEIFEYIEQGHLNPYLIAKHYAKQGNRYSVVRRNWSIIAGYCNELKNYNEKEGK